jgi:folate-binding protein YgfZ
MMNAGETAVGRRPRAFVRVQGPDAADFLERMLSNTVAALPEGGSCEALLLTPKARVIAPLRVWRRADTDFLLLTEPELGPVVRENLIRARFAAKVEIEHEEHTSYVLLGAGDGIPNAEYGTAAVEVLDAPEPDGVPVLADEELELLRIQAATPRFGAEIDDRVMPAEAGLVERAVSLDKGCFPGQEPIARLHYRGHANRALRIVEVETTELPAHDTEISHDGKTVGRITSAQRTNGKVLALAYVRVEVPDDAELAVGDVAAHLH